MIPPPTRHAGLERLNGFLPRAGWQYQRDRNHDNGPGAHSNVSRLSPYLRCRLIAEPEALAGALHTHGVQAADKFVQEVFWRGYWKGWLEQHPATWQHYADERDRGFSRLAADLDLELGYEAAVTGQTGIDAFDAWAEELITTGYLHNHARMWFASIWIFTLKLPWALGADFFLRHLLDGDPASNTLSWRWVAGLHTRGKAYLATPDNIRHYTRGRFHSLDALAPAAVALCEGEPAPHTPLNLARAPTPGGRWGLLLCDEDLTLPERERQPAALAALALCGERSPLATGALAVRFAQGAIEDALARAEIRFGVTADAHFTPAGLDAVADWASARRLERVLLNYVPTGPSRPAVDTLAHHLAARGVALLEPVSDYDAAVWPHAGRGFFQLKRRIPALLDSLVSHVTMVATQPADTAP